MVNTNDTASMYDIYVTLGLNNTKQNKKRLLFLRIYTAWNWETLN